MEKVQDPLELNSSGKERRQLGKDFKKGYHHIYKQCVLMEERQTKLWWTTGSDILDAFNSFQGTQAET